jgi:hypothetical protein
MSTPVLSSLESVKAHLGIASGDTSLDAILTQWLLQIDEAVASFVQRERVPGFHPFESKEATEYYDGTGRKLLVLRRRPATAVASVYVDPAGYYGDGPTAFAAESEWTRGVDWTPRRLDATEQNGSMLLCLRGDWPEGHGNVKVTYTAGYTTIPADLTLAVNDFVKLAYKSQGAAGPLKSETFGRYAYEVMATPTDGEAAEIGTLRSLLTPYREIVI